MPKLRLKIHMVLAVQFYNNLVKLLEILWYIYIYIHVLALKVCEISFLLEESNSNCCHFLFNIYYIYTNKCLYYVFNLNI